MNRRNDVIASILAALVLVALMITLSVVAAQEATPEATPEAGADTETAGPIVCDSTLVLLWLLAEKEYGFGSQTMMDLTRVERGQFAARFDMVAQVQADQVGAEAGASDEAAPVQPDLMATSDVTAEPEAGGGLAQGAILAPALIPEEDPVCTQLRNELETFLLTQLDMELTGQ